MMNDYPFVTLPREALFQFFGEMALPPWRDEHGHEIGGRVPCAPIAERITTWIAEHEVVSTIEET
jgi:hypothetical protein